MPGGPMLKLHRVSRWFFAAALALAAGGASAEDTGIVAFFPHTGETRPLTEKKFDPLSPKVTIVTLNGLRWIIGFADVDQNTNTGFDGPQGAQATQVLLDALAHIGSLVNHPGGEIEITVEASRTAGSGFLARAGSYYFTSPSGFVQGFVQRHLTTGSDPAPGVADCTFQVDFGYSWHFDSALPPPPGQFDFFTVALHEMLHAMGFSSNTRSDGTSALGNNIRTIMDSRLINGVGQPLFNGSGGFAASIPDLLGANGGVYIADTLLGQFPEAPKLYTPSSFALGSSLSRFDASVVDAVMNPTIAAGRRRSLKTIELATLQTIGYTLRAPVTSPEPTLSPAPTETPTPTPEPTLSPTPLPSLNDLNATLLGFAQGGLQYDVNLDGAVDIADLILIIRSPI